MSLFLDDSELAQLTGRRMKSRQIEWLKSEGLRHFVNAKGRPVIVRAAYEAWKNPPPPPAPPVERWQPPEPKPWNETPLGKWQARQREGALELQQQREIERAAREAELAAMGPEIERQRRIARAALVRYHANLRRVAKLRRTPPWADQVAIRAMYLRAQQLTAETGTPHHVDHIIPLQGRLVSGLHVADNLQILTGVENSRKHNKFEVDQ